MQVVPNGSDVPEPISDDEFGAIYEAQFDYVFHSLRRLGAADGDVEDLAHDVFVALYRGRAGYDRGRPIRPWLFGIAFRVSSDYRRRARHRFEVSDDSREFADAAAGADERMAQEEERAMVRDGLAALDLDRRAVFVMHDVDGHAMPEIAAALAVPLNTAYSRLRLARQQFAQVIRRQRLVRESGTRPGPRTKVDTKVDTKADTKVDTKADTKFDNG